MLGKRLHMLAALFLVIGGFNWGATGLGYNGVHLLHGYVNKHVKIPLDKIIYFIVALSALYLSVQRDFYLPFLGETVLPCAMFQPRIPVSENPLVYNIETGEPDKMIIYWAAYSKDNLVDWKEAYGDFSNSGVVLTDQNGVAQVVLRDEPGEYYVRKHGLRRKKLEPHVHYRICGDDGMLSSVRKHYV